MPKTQKSGPFIWIKHCERKLLLWRKLILNDPTTFDEQVKQMKSNTVGRNQTLILCMTPHFVIVLLWHKIQ